MSNYIERRRANNKCIGCGGEPQVDHKYCPKCLERENDRYRKRSEERVSSGLCGRCGKERLETTKLCAKCAELMTARNRASQNAIKAKVFDAYGRACKCCGETMKECLSIDHINGGGTAHRKEIKGGGPGFYRWLVRNNFPPEFQTLCMNCQFGRKHNNGVCPHKD